MSSDVLLGTKFESLDEYIQAFTEQYLAQEGPLSESLLVEMDTKARFIVDGSEKLLVGERQLILQTLAEKLHDKRLLPWLNYLIYKELLSLGCLTHLQQHDIWQKIHDIAANTPGMENCGVDATDFYLELERIERIEGIEPRE